LLGREQTGIPAEALDLLDAAADSPNRHRRQLERRSRGIARACRLAEFL
jgi:hypothetical protein